MRIPPTHGVLRAAVLGTALLLGLAACTSGESDAAVETTTTTTESPETSQAPTTTVEVATTIERVPSSELVSAGHVTIGSTQYDFAFECWAAGAGDILALGVGQDPESSEETQVIVQAFFGQPYVSVLVGNDRILELAIDKPADLFVQSDTIRGSALRFVDAEGAAGVGESLGLGSVNVECESFAPGLPEGYSVS